MASIHNLNLRHLRALEHVATRGSMSAAAQAVGLSQPALTQGLAKLEAQFGAALFVRRPDGMSVTEAGERAIRRAHAAFEQIEAAMRAATRGVRRGFTRPENLLTATQLRGLLSLAEAGSFVGAAVATGLSQPALHRAVRELEQLCGVSLVERRGRGIALTSAGRHLARGFRLAAAELMAAFEEVGADGGPAGRIVIGAMPLSRAQLVPQVVARLLCEVPGARFDIVEGSYHELAEPLRDGMIDLLIGALRDPAPPDLEQRALITDRLAVIARADHPLARAEGATLAELAGYPWITGRAGSPLRRQWERLFDDAGIARPAAPIACGSVLAIRGLLLETDCLTLLSPDQVALEMNSQLLTQVGPLLTATRRIIGAIMRRDWRPTHLQQRCLALLEQVARGPTGAGESTAGRRSR